MKNIISAMDTFGDGEEKGSFDPEAFFAINNDEKDNYSNPFENASPPVPKVEEPIKETTPVEANQPENQSPLTEPEEDDDDPVAEIVEDDFDLFAEGDETITVEDDTHIYGDIEERQVTTRHRLDAVVTGSNDVGMIHLEANTQVTDTPTIESKPVAETKPEPKSEPEFDPTAELSKVATEVDAEEIARSLEQPTTDAIVLTGGIKFQVDEEEISPEDEAISKAYAEEGEGDSSTSYFKYDEPNDESAPPEESYSYNPEQYENTHEEPVKEPAKEPVQEQRKQQQYTGTENQENLLMQFPMYQSDFGLKFQEIGTTKEKPEMLSLADFKDKSKFSGDAYLVKARVAIYQETKKRIEYEFILANGTKTTGSQFNASPTITDETLSGLSGKCYKIEGNWNLYRNTQSLVVNGITNTEDTTPSDFISEAGFDMFDNMCSVLLNSIRTPWIREVLESILFEDNYLARMKQHAAGLSNHDTMEGDLYRHSVRLAMLGYTNSMLYPSVNSDVVVASSLLHDIGKIHEISTTTYTLVGITTGHITIGHNYVRDKIIKLQGEGLVVDENVVLNILHCILSHHGKLEYGSPVTPKTREAFIVHEADMIDSRIANINETLQGKGNRAYSKMLGHDVIDLNI